MIYASGINDLFRVYFITKRDGVDYNLAFIDDGFELFLNDDLGLDLEQQMRAALEIEAEADLLVGQPGGQAFGKLTAEQIGHGKGDAKQTNHDYQNNLRA